MMMRILIDGSSGPQQATGQYITEDELYIYLDDKGIRVKVPLSKVLKMESFQERVVEQVPAAPVEQTPAEPVSVPSPPPTIEQPSNRVKLSMNDIQKIVSQHKETKGKRLPPNMEPERVGTGPDQKTEISVVFTGAEERSLKMTVPAHSIDNDVYTPTLQKEISNNPEVKAIWEKGAIFDGPPKVMGNTVYVKTKNMKANLDSLAGKMDMMNSVNEISQKFKQPEKLYQVDFNMDTPDLGDGFVIEANPFEQPVNLEVGAGEKPTSDLEDLKVATDIDELKITEGPANEDTEQKGGSDEGTSD